MAAFAPTPSFGTFDPRFRNPIGYRSPRDAYDIWQNERDRAAGRGDAREAEFRDYMAGIGGQAGGYQNLVPDLYRGIWGGQGGYRPDEAGAIMREGELQGILGREGEGYLTSDEGTQWQGDPYAGFNYLRDQTQNIEGQAGETAGRLRGVAGEGIGRVSAAAGRIREGIDPERLRLDPGYRARVEGIASGAGGRIDRSLDDPGLQVTGEYLRQRGITDREVGDMGQLAAADIGAGTRAEIGRVERAAAAAGTVNPLGVAAVRQGVLREGLRDSADATTRARLAARGMQGDAAQQIQSTLLGAAGQRADLTRQGAATGAGLRLGATEGAERMRLGAEGGLSDRLMRAGEAEAGFESGNRDAAIGAEARAGEGQMANMRWLQGGLADTMARGEAQSNERNRTAATNRQGIWAGNRDAAFNISNVLAGRAGGIADARRADEREGRGAATGLSQFYTGQLGDWGDRMLRNDDLTQRGTQGAASGYSGWGQSETQNGFLNNLRNSAGRSLGNSLGSMAGRRP